MQHPTTPNPDATIVTGHATVTMTLDVTTLAERIARLVARHLVASAAADSLSPDRNGPYMPDLDRHTVTIADHGPGEHRTRTRLTAGGVYEIHCTCGEYDATAPTSATAERAAADHRERMT